MSRAIRETLAKLIVVETSVNILSRIKETKDYHPALVWMKDEVERVALEMAKLAKQPVKTAYKADEIIDHIKNLRGNEVPIPTEEERQAGEPPHSEVYLASAVTIILDDLVQLVRDPIKLDLLKPLHECAVNVEQGLDAGCVLYDVRKEADEFIELIYAKIAEVS